MGKIVALGFENPDVLDALQEKLQSLQDSGALQLDDAVTVTVDDEGKAKLRHGFSVVRGGAAVGGILGLVVGTLFLAPIAGAAVGAAGGAALGKMTGDYGIDDEFIKKTSETLKPGAAALFLLVRTADAERVLAEIAGTRATVISTTLTSEGEDALRKALSEG
jgi:uncharacterized membrane protein